MEDGFVFDMPFEDYIKVPALNGSSIIHMRRSPLQYRHAQDNPSPDTVATHFGTGAHKWLLEPERINDFVVWGTKEEEKVRNGKVWNQFQADHAGKFIVTVKEWTAIMDTATSAWRHQAISKYINTPGKTEVSMFWTHPYTKRKMKARIDKLIVEELTGGEQVVEHHDRIKIVRKPVQHATIVDLKTTRDSRPFRFCQQAHSLGYVVKMALYAQGYEILTGIKPDVKMIALESKAPHEGVPYNVSEEVRLVGLEELDKLIDRLSECEKANHWPAAYEMEEEMVLPAWASYEAETELELEV